VRSTHLKGMDFPGKWCFIHRLSTHRTESNMHSLILPRLLIALSLASAYILPNFHPQLMFPHNTTALADEYGIECDREPGIPFPGPNPTVCEALIEDICTKLVRIDAARGIWTWSRNEHNGCALGYHIPNGFPIASKPSRFECEEYIYGQMIELCGTRSQYNIGMINVAALPRGNVGRDAEGAALSPGHPMYLMAPKFVGRGF